MKKLLTIFLALTITATPSFADYRIKDIVSVEGVRENILIGYGLVVGLNGTGDKLNNSAFTEQSLIAYLERLGVNTRGQQLKTKNVAAVTVTATLPPFARQGSRIDVTVSAMGDAKSLQGGILLATPLMGADGEVYAVSQGQVAIGGFEAKGKSGSSITKAVPTNGYISNGAIIEKEIAFNLNSLPELNLSLRNPDIITARNIARAINVKFGEVATVSDPGTVRLAVPPKYSSNVATMIADIEPLTVESDQVARIVVDEASGTIVMGENVRVDTVAIAQGNLIVRVDEEAQVSQPNPLAPAGAQTAVVPKSTVSVSDGGENKLAVMKKGASLREVVRGLNALGVGPRDLITILQTVKAAGALQADIEMR